MPAIAAGTQNSTVRPGNTFVSWSRETPEGGGQRKHRRSSSCAGRRQRGHHVRLGATLLRVVKRSNQCAWRVQEHGRREESSRLSAAQRTRDRLRRRTERPSYVEHVVLVTSILVRCHCAPLSRSTTSLFVALVMRVSWPNEERVGQVGSTNRRSVSRAANPSKWRLLLTRTGEPGFTRSGQAGFTRTGDHRITQMGERAHLIG